ncbi:MULTISPECIES: hypothetical protein [unclassified Moorena]|uniref:hypothetical protein n=1 Tax=unclassified Moorena TaxID=2683338 RepID=UPI0013C05A15|nr:MULTISPECIES: hypothetical protein [unclassified Moorena]NEO07384.1 hypothetical protein [Moorena sp. SIO3I8]NEP27014.1 hypothetical protein [Moorena sp. SIO3I6]
MGETTAVPHGGDPQDRAASPRPRCIATPYSLLPVPYSLFPLLDKLIPHPEEESVAPPLSHS